MIRRPRRCVPEGLGVLDACGVAGVIGAFEVPGISVMVVPSDGS